MHSTIVNVALLDIGRNLHASVSGLQWTIDAYTLVLASLPMLSGATADTIGPLRVFQVGLRCSPPTRGVRRGRHPRHFHHDSLGTEYDQQACCLV
jgi:hypothetical protein